MKQYLSSMDVKVISFDGDGTLWDFEKVMHHSLDKVMEELEKQDPVAANKLDVNRLIEIREKVFLKLKGKVTDLEEIRLESFKESLRVVDRPNDELAERLNKIYLKHRFEDIELYEDVLPTLNYLKEKYTLGMISNGNSYPERCGLEDLFDFVIFSQHIGKEKPDPEIFYHAINKLKCNNDEIIHIGDSLEEDISGAKNAGITGIWLNRNKDESIENNHQFKINSLTELMDVL